MLPRGVGTARALGLRAGKRSTGSPSPQRVCTPALFAEELRANVRWAESGQIRQHFGRVVSTAAGIRPKLTLPHYRDEQFINGEPPRGQDWRTWSVRAAEGRIHRRVSREMCSASAWPGDLNRRDFRELIAPWEALNTSQDPACALGAESPTKPRAPGC